MSVLRTLDGQGANRVIAIEAFILEHKLKEVLDCAPSGPGVPTFAGSSNVDRYGIMCTILRGNCARHNVIAMDTLIHRGH